MGREKKKKKDDDEEVEKEGGGGREGEDQRGGRGGGEEVEVGGRGGAREEVLTLMFHGEFMNVVFVANLSDGTVTAARITAELACSRLTSS